LNLTTERANPLRQCPPGGGGCATARRPAPAASKLFLRRSVFVKRFTHEMTLREVPAASRGRPAALHPTERHLRPDMHERRAPCWVRADATWRARPVDEVESGGRIDLADRQPQGRHRARCSGRAASARLPWRGAGVTTLSISGRQDASHGWHRLAHQPGPAHGHGPPPPEELISGLYGPVHAGGWRRRGLGDLLSSAGGERALLCGRAGQQQRRPLRWPCSQCGGAVRWHTGGAEWAACSGARKDAMRQGETTHDTALARGFLRSVGRNV
jgi:hypothetical protein